MQDHRIVADAVRKDTLELSKLLTAAKDVQWDAPPSPQRSTVIVSPDGMTGKPFSETGVVAMRPARRSREVTDTTAQVALDERRLKLREAVRAADNALEACASSLDIALSRLERALTEWEGEDV